MNVIKHICTFYHWIEHCFFQIVSMFEIKPFTHKTNEILMIFMSASWVNGLILQIHNYGEKRVFNAYNSNKKMKCIYCFFPWRLPFSKIDTWNWHYKQWHSTDHVTWLSISFFKYIGVTNNHILSKLFFF